MWPLVFKDFTIIKNNLKNFIILTAIMVLIFAFQGSPLMALALIPLPLLYSPINRMLYDDEKNNTLRFITTLPVKKVWVVYSRYLTVGMLFLALIAIQLITGFLLVVFGIFGSSQAGEPGTWDSLLALSAATLVPITIFISIYLPVAYKFGYINASNAMKYLFIGYVIVFSGLTALVSNISPSSPVGHIIHDVTAFVRGTSPVVSFAGALAISAAIYLISMKTSAAAFKKRPLF